MNNPESVTDISHNPPNTHYIPTLDGFRGFAILMVICYHYFAFSDWTRFGWIGVDFFFVLSGYLITLQLVKKRGSQNFFLNFFRNRILRIFPLYFIVIAGFYIIISFVVSSVTAKHFEFYNTYAIAFVTMIQNFLFIQKGLPTQPHLIHLWSIAVEEQFYLLWPFLILLLPKKNAHLFIWFLLVPAVIGLRYFQYVHYPDSLLNQYFNTFCRFDSFFVGASVFFLSQRGGINIKLVGAVMAIVVISILTGADSYKLNSDFFRIIGYSLIAIFAGCLVHLIVYHRPKILIKIFSWKPLVSVGKISYGIYIIHYPLYYFLVLYWNNKNPEFQNSYPLINSLTCGIACFIFTYFLSWVSYRYFESFFLKFKSP